MEMSIAKLRTLVRSCQFDIREAENEIKALEESLSKLKNAANLANSNKIKIAWGNFEENKITTEYIYIPGAYLAVKQHVQIQLKRLNAKLEILEDELFLLKRTEIHP